MTGPDDTVHVVGLGLAGLSAALRLATAGRRVALYESAGQAGGRCRSFHDDRLGREIDNGNHLLLSGNERALAYLDAIGARGEVHEFSTARFPFVDLRTGERWCLEPGAGRLPWWLLDRSRRVRGAGLLAHLSAGRILIARRSATVSEAVGEAGPMFARFWEPLTVAVLNTTPREGSATLMRDVLAATFGRGGRFARPIIAKWSLGRAFVEPALRRLRELGASLRFHATLHELELRDGRVATLDFGSDSVTVGPGQQVILALPPGRLAGLVPGTRVPHDRTVIVNAHFRFGDGDDGPVDFLGVLNALTHWIFRRPGLVSTTISAAHHLGADRGDADDLLDRIWVEVRTALRLPTGSQPSGPTADPREARHLRPVARGARRPTRHGDALREPLPCRRRGRDGTAGDHRGRHPLWRDGSAALPDGDLTAGGQGMGS